MAIIVKSFDQAGRTLGEATAKTLEEAHKLGPADSLTTSYTIEQDGEDLGEWLYFYNETTEEQGFINFRNNDRRVMKSWND